jgi:hypothetical protein
MHMPSIASRKSSFEAACPFELCSSILIGDLELGSTHQRRVLKGRLVEDAIKMQSVQTVLEDEYGDVVVVSKQAAGWWAGVKQRGNVRQVDHRRGPKVNWPALPAMTSTPANQRSWAACLPPSE